MSLRSSKMQLYVMRHGQTDWNLQGKIQGHTNILLNDAGLQMAKTAALALKNESFEKIFCSSLIRARQTLEPYLKLQEKPQEVAYLDLLQEISFGEDEGRNYSEIKKTQDEIYNFFFKTECYRPKNGAESVADLKLRAQKFLTLVKETQASKVLAVSHGAFIHALIAVVKQSADEDFWKTKRLNNCSLTCFELKHGSWCVTREGIDLLQGESI